MLQLLHVPDFCYIVYLVEVQRRRGVFLGDFTDIEQREYKLQVSEAFFFLFSLYLY